MEQINPLLSAVSDKVSETQALDIPSLREIDLLAWLRDMGFLNARVESQAALYRIHFLMRNALYQLARADDANTWYFSPVGVEWTAAVEFGPGGAQVGQVLDRGLEAYYLDMTNAVLADHEVDALLNDFWRRYQAYSDDVCGDITAALHILELNRVDSMAQLKLQYRRLVMQAHPDRGGSKEKMQRINSAFNKIKNTFSL